MQARVIADGACSRGKARAQARLSYPYAGLFPSPTGSHAEPPISDRVISGRGRGTIIIVRRLAASTEQDGSDYLRAERRCERDPNDHGGQARFLKSNYTAAGATDKVTLEKIRPDGEEGEGS